MRQASKPFRVRLPMTLMTAALLIAVLPGWTARAGAESETGISDQDEIEALAFMLGEWRLETWFALQDGSRTTGSATLKAQRDLDGRAVTIVERYPSGSNEPDFMSTRTLVFNPRLGKLLGSGINSLGNAKQYEAVLHNDSLIVNQTGMLFEGRPGANRITFYDIRGDRFHVVSEHSEDDGQSWNAEFGYTAFRVR